MQGAPARMRRGSRLALAVLGALACVAVAGAIYLDYRARAPLPLEAPATVVVAPGMTLSTAAAAISAAGAGPRWLFVWRARMRGLEASLRRGEYRLTPGESADDVLDRLARGVVLSHRFRIAEGSTVSALLARLAADERLDFHLAGATAADLMARLGLAGHAEGRFFPDTYQFTRGDRAAALLKRAEARMVAVLAAVWQQRQADLGIDEPQALVLASLIEKETGVAEDRRRIAGVFHRRLQLGMRLQADPTVIYGLGQDFDGDLKRAHLAADGPYNTYRRRGLPPTPIAFPSRASLEAAVDPAPGDALYFVARGDGSSYFSATLAEHNAAVRRYQLTPGGQAPAERQAAN